MTQAGRRDVMMTPYNHNGLATPQEGSKEEKRLLRLSLTVDAVTGLSRKPGEIADKQANENKEPDKKPRLLSYHNPIKIHVANAYRIKNQDLPVR